MGDVEEALIGHGKVEGPFTEIDGYVAQYLATPGCFWRIPLLIANPFAASCVVSCLTGLRFARPGFSLHLRPKEADDATYRTHFCVV